MGGSEKKTEQSTQSNTIDPWSKGMLTANYSGAQTRADSLKPYSGPLTAGFNPTQTQAQGVLSQIALDPMYSQIAQGATSGAQGVLNSNPLTASDLQQYMNPYQSSVIDASISQNERARQIAQNQSHMQDTAGAAFGGSRSGVADALTNEGYDRNSQQNLATLNSNNFTQAQNASLAAKNLQLNAASGVANLNNNALGVAANQGGILASVGDAQQAQQQKEYSDAYNAYMQGQALTVQQQNLLNSALGMIPVQQTVNSNGTSTTSSNPGLGGILSSIGKIGMSAAAFA